MTLEYFDNKNTRNLIEEIFLLSIEKKDIPFNTSILPIGLTSITHIFGNKQSAIFQKASTPLAGIILTGQFYGSYTFRVNEEGKSLGMNFHPTALYKILKINFSEITNKHIPIIDIDIDFYTEINRIFSSKSNDINNLVKSLKEYINTINLNINRKTIYIDKTIDIIRSKNGLLSVNDLVEEISLSQKTFETYFKEVIGLTPGKYIRMYRFLQ